MNIIKSFNNTIDYLETVLDDEIDEKKVTQLSGYSYSMFSRLFSILTETTLSDYLRSRRLTEAAMILRDTDEKIIDVAFKFGYESSDSFGTAFKNFHGFTPSEVRNGKPFKLVSRVQLALGVRGGRSINITIQKKQAFAVAEVNEHSINSSLCPSVWDKLYEKYSHDKLASLGSGQSMGVCHDVENPSIINYMAGYINIYTSPFLHTCFQALSVQADCLRELACFQFVCHFHNLIFLYLQSKSLILFFYFFIFTNPSKFKLLFTCHY